MLVAVRADAQLAAEFSGGSFAEANKCSCKVERVGTAGSDYIDFQRALKTKNLMLIESAARELPSLSLEDSLAVLLVMAEQQDGRYPRAAAKWAGRAIAEKRLSLDDSRRVLALVDVMLTAPHAVVPHLRAYL